ncbi:lysylphosphatidylglycerol synthase-like protein [Winogradskyella epiphytica]|uniref:Lysylphosphatidylglycerol synthase-like protein n=2 Tax=Winogradskyella epiphytica TaxID=262005 RepID=A0A2V4Y283_9FLAO|nr:lysylphosphatidylglycerol synthase domain-containing protein [Winogradskyella epiphytica]PYE82974.1 lysylphosphatidylglycerol synthase-like protein [Winogradskyella epiphytica]
MPLDVTYKSKQFLFVLIKISIVVCAFYFIYAKIAKNDTLKVSSFLSFLNQNDAFSPKLILILLLLSIFNWYFEILKWQHLVKTIMPISFVSALEQSLGSLTASLITPNRIGDYGAKAIYFRKGFRTKIVLLNLLGNLAQMSITLIFGVIGLLLLIQRYALDVNFSKLILLFVTLIAIGFITWLATKHRLINIKGQTLSTVIDFVKHIPLKRHGLILLLSLLRYAIFSFQFYFLLGLFGVNMSYFEAMIIISSMYLLASIVPSISLFDVVVKGSVAVFLFSYVEVNELVILSITTLMWLFNFVIPSLFGSYFVLNFKLPKAVA